MEYPEKDESLAMPGIKKRISPYKMWIGSFVPNWLEARKEISPGAKLVYARLARFAGKDEKCNPKIGTIAESLGTNKRQIIRFIDELRKSNLIERKRNGLNRSNDYFFLETEWMNLDIEQSDNLSLQEGTNLSLPYNMNKENHLKESIEESTPLNPPRGKRKSKKKILSLVEFLDFCGKAFDDIGRLKMWNNLQKPLEEFYEYRKDIINSPFKSQMGVTKMVNKLVEESNVNHKQAKKMIDATIASEKWPGIYPVNGKQSNGKEKQNDSSMDDHEYKGYF